MNIKSLVKDEHWMRRVRHLFGKLSARGHDIPLRRANSALDSLYGGASMSQYPDTRRAAFAHSAPFGGDSAGLGKAGSFATRPLKEGHSAPFGGGSGDSSGLVAAGSYVTRPLQEVSYEGPTSDDGSFLNGDVTLLPPPPQSLRMPARSETTLTFAPPPRQPLKQPRV
jgi:hypothetical protein